MKEDFEIIELYWARSESAVQETDEKYGAKLHTLSGRILPDAEDAKECVNDTYLGAWNAMPPQRPLALFAFLARICRNIACDMLDKLHAKKRSAEVSAHRGARRVHRRPCVLPGSRKPRDRRSLKRLFVDAPHRRPALLHAPLLVYGFHQGHC